MYGLHAGKATNHTEQEINVDRWMGCFEGFEDASPLTHYLPTYLQYDKRLLEKRKQLAGETDILSSSSSSSSSSAAAAAASSNNNNSRNPNHHPSSSAPATDGVGR